MYVRACVLGAADDKYHMSAVIVLYRLGSGLPAARTCTLHRRPLHVRALLVGRCCCCDLGDREANAVFARTTLLN